MIGDLGPGSYNPISVQFVDTTTFSSATLQVTLSSLSIPVSGGGIFVLNSPILTATLLPSVGGSLQAGIDTVVLTGTGSFATVPEPASGLAVAITLLAAAALKRRRTAR